MSFSNVQSALESQSESEVDHTLGYLRQPGGFRRQYIANRARERGYDEPAFTNITFVDFLVLFGHFAGEELEEIEESSEDGSRDVDRRKGRGERDSLLPRPIPVRKKSTSAAARRGTASVTQAVLMVR